MIQKREVISHTPMRSEWLRMKKQVYPNPIYG